MSRLGKFETALFRNWVSISVVANGTVPLAVVKSVMSTVFAAPATARRASVAPSRAGSTAFGFVLLGVR